MPELPANETPAAGENSQQAVDNNVGDANQPGAGERSSAMMERPDWVPEKFFKDGVIDYKGIATSYAELEKKQGSSPAPKGEEKPAAESTTKAESGDLTAQPVTIPGVTHDNMQKYTKEAAAGGLKPESYAELAKAGYPKAVVDAYVRSIAQPDTASLEAAAVERAKFVDETIKAIGGKEVLTDMVTWAGQNLSEADLKVYNESVSSNDPALVKQAVNGLYHLYSQEVGSEPKESFSGKTPVIDGLQPFKSNEEVARAMSNPKYDKDPAYRDEIARRLAISDVFQQSIDVQSMKDPDKRVYRHQS